MVADVDADLEGQAETGSVEIEERNVLARTTVERADVDEWLSATYDVVGSAVSISSSMHVVSPGERIGSSRKHGLYPLRNAAWPPVF